MATTCKRCWCLADAYAFLGFRPRAKVRGVFGESEVVPGFPDRILPADENAAAILRKRTLTNLYNERPAWLAHAPRDLDAAVAAAYGWPADISDDEALRRLFELNKSRSSDDR